MTRGKIVLWFFLDMFGFGIPDLFRFLRETFPDKAWRHWGPVVLYASFFMTTMWLDCLWVFGVWAWSLLTGFWAVFRVRTWYEHVGLECAGGEATHRFAANSLARFLFFPHNTYCHYEHHRWVGVPCYNLPKLRELVGGRPVLTAWQVFVSFGECNGQVGAGRPEVRPSAPVTQPPQ